MLTERDAGRTYNASPSVAHEPRRAPAQSIAKALREWLARLAQPHVSPASTAAESIEQIAPDWPSLDIIADAVKVRLDEQNDQVKQVDAKANFGLVAATLLTAGVTGLGRALAESGQKIKIPEWTIPGWGFRDRHLSADTLVDWVTIASLVVYLAIVACTYLSYRIQTFKSAPNLDRLLEKYGQQHESERETKAAIAWARADAFKKNTIVIDRKVRWLNRAMRLLIVEAVMLIVIAVIQVNWL